jgi:hypothetical protein
MTEDEADRFSGQLAAIASHIRELGGSFISLVLFDDGSERIVEMTPNASPEARIAYYGIRCGGDADKLIKLLLKDGKENGHDSIYLSMIERAEYLGDEKW